MQEDEKTACAKEQDRPGVQKSVGDLGQGRADDLPGAKSISDLQLSRYKMHRSLFQNFCEDNGLSTEAGPHTDDNLADYFDMCFLDLKGISLGRKFSPAWSSTTSGSKTESLPWLAPRRPSRMEKVGARRQPPATARAADVRLCHDPNC